MERSVNNEKLLARFEAECNSPMQQSFEQGNQHDPAAKEHPECILYSYLASLLEIVKTEAFKSICLMLLHKISASGLIAFSRQ